MIGRSVGRTEEGFNRSLERYLENVGPDPIAEQYAQDTHRTDDRLRALMKKYGLNWPEEFRPE